MDQDTSEERIEVVEARETLGETVEAIAYKANAPKRTKEQAVAKVHAAKAKIEDVKQQTKARIGQTKTRIETDPRAQKLQNSVRTDKSAGNDRHGETASAAASTAERLQPALDTIRRHPTSAAAAAAAALGVLVGRATRRR